MIVHQIQTLECHHRCHKNVVWLEEHNLISRGMMMLWGKLVVHVVVNSCLITFIDCVMQCHVTKKRMN